MAESQVEISPGVGAPLRTKLIGGKHHTVTELATGDANSSNLVQPPDADGVASSRVLPAGGMLWNGSGWDRRETNGSAVSLLAAADRTATVLSAAQTNRSARGVLLDLAVATAGTGTLNLRVRGPAGSAHQLIGATGTLSPPIGGRMVLVICPGVVNADHLFTYGAARSMPLTRQWYAEVVHSDASTWNYSLSAYYLI